MSARARLASGNAHKLEELRAALPGWELELLGRGRDTRPRTERRTRRTRVAKAGFGRAVARSRAPGCSARTPGSRRRRSAGAPGIASARWATDGVARLLGELAGADDRRARYVCALVALAPDGEEVRVQRHARGRVATSGAARRASATTRSSSPRGEERTVAELGDAWKRATRTAPAPPRPAAVRSPSAMSDSRTRRPRPLAAADRSDPAGPFRPGRRSRPRRAGRTTS